MGIVVSTTNYAPLALTSAIIGFVSFAFTVGTFLRVVWVNITTMSEAPHEVHGYLTNLRQELLEEKASIRVMRKECRKWHRALRRDGSNSYLGNVSLGIELDDVTLKTMGDTIKVLIRRFKDIEAPFLEEGEEGVGAWKDHRSRRRNGSNSPPYYEHFAYAPPEKEKGRSQSRNDADRGRHRRDEDETEEDAFWAQRTRYARFTFRRRLVWLRKKADAQRLFETLSRVQIRRIARQVGGISVLMHEYGSTTLRMEDTLRRIDERTGRIVGMRRVD